ncbi:MAG: hypothetical protein ACOYKQ_13445 [Polymorphobacter sp.]
MVTEADAKASNTTAADTTVSVMPAPAPTPVSPTAPARTRRAVPAKKAVVTSAKTNPKPKAPSVKTKAPTAKLKSPITTKTKPAMPVPETATSAKEKKPKLVRDGFTIPKAEYLVLGELKMRAAGLQFPVKKSELVRAGIKALAAMPGTALLAALQAVPPIKTGRPSKN